MDKQTIEDTQTEEKSCLNCKTVFRKGQQWNSSRTYKINISQSVWATKKYCCRKCGQNYKHKEAYKENPNRKIYAKQWRQQNKEHIKLYWKTPGFKQKQKDYRTKNRDRLTEYQKEYLKRHNPKKDILNHYNNKCAICDMRQVLDIHHITPGKKGRHALNINEYIVLCPNHHTMFHRGVITKKDLLQHQKKAHSTVYPRVNMLNAPSKSVKWA